MTTAAGGRGVARRYGARCLAALLPILLPSPARATQYEYIALTVAPEAARQGTVVAGGITWECRGNRCSTSLPRSSPDVPLCSDLSHVVGRLRSFGHSESHLSPAQMEKCNLGVSDMIRVPPPGPAPSVPAGSLPGTPGRQPGLQPRFPEGTGPWSVKYPDGQRFLVLAQFNNQAVLDRETGLVWERTPLDERYNWFHAVDGSCIMRVIGERMGWRLARVEELTSLLELRSPGIRGLPDGHPFTSVTDGSIFWSATTEPRGLSAFAVTFPTGAITDGGRERERAAYLTWCVRGGRGYDGQELGTGDR